MFAGSPGNAHHQRQLVRASWHHQHQLVCACSKAPRANAPHHHHQHQLVCACPCLSAGNRWAVRIISISRFVRVRSRPAQSASSASAGLCLFAGSPGIAHHQRQLGRASGHHQHQLVCACSKAPRAHRPHPQQHCLVCACPEAILARRIISISWFVLVENTQAVRIISISWVVLVRRQPRQCASAASAGSC